MWCPNCETEVAAAVDEADGSATCVSCGDTIDAGRGGERFAPVAAAAGVGTAPRTTGTAEDRARELLDRWSHLIPDDEPAAEFETAEPAPTPEPQPARRDEPSAVAATTTAPRLRHRVDRPAPAASRPQPGATGGARIRIDGGHPTFEAANRSAPVRPPHAAPADAPRVHAAHRPGPSAPHFDPVLAGDFDAPIKKAGSTAALGQFLAYAGVLGLTVGGAFVVWSYFGGPPGYAPTGWLLTTGGQMLLFLGIVTLISGGMDRTSHEVRTRIERLGESIHRLEQGHTHAVRAPHVAAERFAGESGERVEERDAVSA